MSDGCESNIFLFMAGMQCHLWVSKKKHRNKGNYSYWLKSKHSKKYFFQYCNTVHNTAIIILLYGSHSRTMRSVLP